MLLSPNLLRFSFVSLLAAASLSAAKTHQVQAGDTLSSIARRNGTTASKLMSINGIKDAKLLKVGQVLKVSGTSATRPSSRATGSSARNKNSHSVKSGETLYSISRSNGVSVSRLTALNPGLNPSKLKIGQKIRISGSAAPTKPARKPQVAASKPPAPKKVVSKPAPKPTPVVAAKPKPAPAVARRSPVAPTPVLASATIPVSANLLPAGNTAAPEKPAPAPSAIATVVVEKEISFGALANKHRTSTKQLNELNGLTLKPTKVLAKGSELYVPGT